MAREYGDVTANTSQSGSDIGNQLQTFYFQKKALIELKKEQFFSPMASVIGMPKHMGKKIRRYHYLPMLDDLNVNDQGIDAAAVAQLTTQFYVTYPDPCFTLDAGSAAAVTAINDNINDGGSAETVATDGADGSYKTGYTLIAMSTNVVKYADTTDATTATAAVIGAVSTAGYGNLYGSSKDVGTIAGKLPALSETGGRVNRVGFKRVELEGDIEKFGFFRDYTQESIDFDTDAELEMHVNREMLRGASEMTEDALQIDILNGVGVHRYAGTATTKATVSGETGAVCEVTYADLSALSIELDNNRCPKETKIISGTRMVDTKVIPAARALFIGSEMIPTIERMTDHFSNQAYIPLAHYAAGTSALNGEIGTVGMFRIVVVPEMMHWAGVGALESTNAGYQATNSRYNVYPMLVIGSESFTTIGFQTNGKSTKFKIFHKKPGMAVADRTDPYGETGFMSIKWWYGMMVLRPERLALVYSVGRV